ncbi:mannan endo-1,4-beta-mannosidase [Micractinium conductrix]|uniref:mannan endo-1,4-beta-mannosidase n=1 Tax=Micractinium conductrix TaxID=554055 RepID=A0A2P6VBN1_9CHLO|nr:mannan endo-1,4-beta-mannosidase [Micractinium conductrix]|eukprot:PSC71493.1 mannan endo-1,4-beta-mannosidase [Micractinium conductrix]
MLSRRAKEGGAATVDPPAGPAAAAGRTVHHSKSMPAHLAAVSASEWLDGEGGAPSGRRRGSTLLKWACVLLALLVLLRHALRPGAGGYTHTSFVTVEGSQFWLDCRPFYLAGFNLETAAEAAAARNAFAAGRRAGGESTLRSLFGRAAASGLNVVRTWAHTSDPAYPLQVSPGVYSEAAFQALDAAIAEAEAAGLRVILSLADNWKRSGGVDEYVDWSTTAPPRDPKFPPINDTQGDVSVEDHSEERRRYEDRRKALFFTDREARRLYRDHVRAVLERRNTLTGRLYRDDPTILAFDLLNELRCSSYETAECTDLVSRWVQDMSQHFKSLDQRHLLTVGSEGFYGERDTMKEVNPGAPGSDWASKAGQDFIANHQLPTIDFAAFHLWPDNWNTHNATFHRKWVEQHYEDCATLLKKPCLLEEFGKRLGNDDDLPSPTDIALHRDNFFVDAYAAVEAGVEGRKGAGGSLYWRWGLNPHDPSHPGAYGVLPQHSTFALISAHAQLLRTHMLVTAPHKKCPLVVDCWVPATSFGGLLRRCEDRPSVCADHRSLAKFELSTKSAGNVTTHTLRSHGPPVFATHAACCLPGLGAFGRGCSTTWV